MPIIKKHMYPFKVEKGCLVGAGQCDGHHPDQAVRAAVDSFQEEFGREPNQEDCHILVFFTTHQTHAEVIEHTEGYGW